jgi:uncharacterized protein involved in outer membrane biogenesis
LAVLAAGALLFLFVGLPLIVDSTRCREALLSRASSALGRPVMLSSLKLSLWGSPRLSLRGVSVGNPDGFGSDALARVEEVAVELAWSSLWSRRVKVERLVLRRARVFLERRSDGRSSLDGLAWAGPQPEAGLLAAAGVVTTGERSLVVSRILVEDASLDFRDACADFSAQAEGIALDARVERLPLAGTPMDILQQAAFDGTLRVRSVRTDGVALDGMRCGFSLGNAVARLSGGEAALNGGRLRFSATVDIQQAGRPTFALKAELGDIRLTSALGARYLGRFLACFAGGLEGRVGKGRLDLAWRGSTRDEVNASLAGKGELGLKVKSLDLSHLLTEFSIGPEPVTFSEMGVVFSVGNGVVSNTLRMSALETGAELSGTLRLSDEVIDYWLVPEGKLKRLLHGRKVPIIGTIRKPYPDVQRAVLDEAQEHLKERFEDTLRDLLP